MRRLLFAAVGLTLAMGASAYADDFNFYLTVQEDGGFTLPPADAVDVDVNLTSAGHATITFTANNPLDGYTYQLFSTLFAVNGGFTIAGGSATGGTTPVAGAPSGGSLDNMGTFSEDFTSHSDTQVAFMLNQTSGTTWTSASNVLAGDTGCNAGPGFYPGECPFLAAAQVKVFLGSTQQTQMGNSNLDLAGTGTVPGSIPEVPEPSSWILFATAAVIGLVGVGRRKFSSR